MEKGNILSYKGYNTRIVYDNKIGKLTGIIEDINDLVYFESDNTESIVNEFHLAVNDYLDFCNENGIEPDKSFKGTFNVRIDTDLHKKLSQYAFLHGESLNSAVEKSIKFFIEYQPLEILDKFQESISSSFSFATENLIYASNWELPKNLDILQMLTEKPKICLDNSGN